MACILYGTFLVMPFTLQVSIHTLLVVTTLQSATSLSAVSFHTLVHAMMAQHQEQTGAEYPALKIL